jgi:glycosidase
MYPANVNEVAFNLVGSHDTPRILTECGNNIDRVKQVFALLLSFIGTPCIYYGDEIGLIGAQDPGCRKCMEWDENKQNRDLFEHIQKLIRLRRENPLLANEGKISFISPEYHEKCLAFVKSNGKSSIIVVLNTCSEKVEYTIPLDFKGKTVKSLWNDEEISLTDEDLTIQIQGNGFAILKF